MLSTEKEEICPDLERYRHNGALLIPANHLATLGLKYIHPGIKHWLYSKGGWPGTHVLVMEGQNTLHLLSPHCTPVYLANEAITPCGNLPLDNNLDKITSAKIYCTKPEDGIVQIEITTKNNRPTGAYVDLNEFCRIFREDTGNSKIQREIWSEETIDPIKREWLTSFPMNDVEIASKKKFINDALDQSFTLKHIGYNRA